MSPVLSILQVLVNKIKRVNGPSEVESYRIEGLTWAEFIEEDKNITSIDEGLDWSEFVCAEANVTWYGDAWAYEKYHIEGLTWADFVPPGTNIHVYGDMWGTEWERLQIEGLTWSDFVE